MKKILFILAISSTMFTISSCKKSSSSTTTTVITNADVAGNWEGRFASSPSTVYVQMAKFIFDASGNSTVTDSIGGSAYSGTYVISGDSLISTNNISPTESVNFRFKIINNKTRLEGKWLNSAGTPSGIIYEDKKSSTVVSNTNIKGRYAGRYLLNPATVFTTASIFIFDDSGNATETDSIGGNIFSGTYTISGDSLITTVTGSSTVNFRFKVSKADARLDGKWINLTSPSATGLIYEDRH